MVQVLIRQPPVYSMTTTESIDENLASLVAKTVAEKLTAEAITEAVEARVSKLVEGAVESALGRYGEIGKLIEAKVSDALRVDRLDLPAYGDTVATILRKQIDARVSDLIAGQLSKDMDALLSLAPKEVKLSEIAQEMLDDHSSEYGENLITVIVHEPDWSTTSKWVYLDPREHYTERDKHRCAFSFAVNEDGSIFGASLEGKEVKPGSHIGRSYGFAQKLRAYVACGTRIILDEDEVSTGKGDY